ncbi:hypothetical protein D8T49_04185 [Vibrio vulnificus]|nr:hypothetical protein [Vibrio vulnificus]EGQ9783787.1 hypothetical protein [Vibrio vulnificus]RZQ00849.1 hypothetical protein D8T37_16375 [Vibrio vulnificus]RZQ49956.1 hypothetical protein D8T49_04185 [Vibrio vulnificus]HAS8168340.1 hypothetical protein [Vibrio vulnificus]
MIKKTAIMYQILIKNPEICDLFVSIFLLLTLIAPLHPNHFSSRLTLSSFYAKMSTRSLTKATNRGEMDRAYDSQWCNEH